MLSKFGLLNLILINHFKIYFSKNNKEKKNEPEKEEPEEPNVTVNNNNNATKPEMFDMFNESLINLENSNLSTSLIK